jgi:hypothetical protein
MKILFQENTWMATLPLVARHDGLWEPLPFVMARTASKAWRDVAIQNIVFIYDGHGFVAKLNEISL